MYYTIYKITNIVNSKIYIGQHKTDDLNDEYMGSGLRLNRAIKKYGLDNFIKEILYVFDNEEDMNSKEKELVNEEFVKLKTTYNICIGGQGGFSYINSNNMIMNNEMRSNSGKIGGNIHKIKMQINLDYRKYRIDIFNKTCRTTPKDYNFPFKNKKHKEETKKKIGENSSKHQQGCNNSQYGTCWVTNGFRVMKIKKEEYDSYIANGYRKGRK